MSAVHTFKATFGLDLEASASAPGRVNMLGEHTDYNDGFVLPTVVPQRTIVDVARSRTRSFEIRSVGAGAPSELCSYSEGDPPPSGYARYVHGCFEALRERGVEVPPLALLIRSSVPIGVGLSSSAALEVAVLRALRELLRFDINDVDLALAAQRAESHYVGVHCGIMDQMAASLGASGYMLFLDTRTLERRRVRFPAGSDVVVLDSGVQRSLQSTSYNERRAECQAAADALGVRALRDVPDLGAVVGLPPVLAKRARHVITENARVLAATQDIGARQFGELMNASHASLRDDFEVSVEPLDVLVAALQAHADVYGARLTGAGFGGACVALTRAGAAARVKARVLRDYAVHGYRGRPLV